jgi:hypothetical protein
MGVETTDWDSLRMLRMGGLKPSSTVIVTTKPQMPRRLEGMGCMTILHKAGTPMPVQLLDGLEVIFWFDTCGITQHVMDLARANGVTFARSQTWCSCGNLLSLFPMSCESMAAAVEWLETGYVGSEP